ncbi:MAG: DNA repair protein RadC [Defluviitaleaceae bacterium]|nr:DNA repair protein RadC [Defluviitaleaceae bacterium]
MQAKAVKGAGTKKRNPDLPREKLNAKGAAALTDVELLQAVVGSGGPGNDYRQIAKNLNDAICRAGAEKIEIDDIRAVKGIGEAKATVIFAALEFWRRKFAKQTEPPIDSPEAAAKQFNEIRNKRQEYFALLTLDGARRPINNRIITIGTLTASLVHPREVFSYAIEDRAASIIVAHNHPSGALEISEQDRKVTETLRQAGELLGIRLDDHLILTGDGFISAL